MIESGVVAVILYQPIQNILDGVLMISIRADSPAKLVAVGRFQNAAGAGLFFSGTVRVPGAQGLILRAGFVLYRKRMNAHVVHVVQNLVVFRAAVHAANAPDLRYHGGAVALQSGFHTNRRNRILCCKNRNRAEKKEYRKNRG